MVVVVDEESMIILINNVESVDCGITNNSNSVLYYYFVRKDLVELTIFLPNYCAPSFLFTIKYTEPYDTHLPTHKV